MMRTAKRDVTLKDVSLKSGDEVILLSHTTKIEAQNFEDPDEFKLDNLSKPVDRGTLQYQQFLF